MLTGLPRDLSYLRIAEREQQRCPACGEGACTLSHAILECPEVEGPRLALEQELRVGLRALLSGPGYAGFRGHDVQIYADPPVSEEAIRQALDEGLLPIGVLGSVTQLAVDKMEQAYGIDWDRFAPMQRLVMTHSGKMVAAWNARLLQQRALGDAPPED